MLTYETLFWVYLINLLMLILHEMDSVYWQEWRLFHLPGGITGFLLVHFPLFFSGLYGLVLVENRLFSGLVISLVVSLAGLFAFAIHSYFIRKGHTEFTTFTSQAILICTFIVSMVQAGITIYLFGQL